MPCGVIPCAYCVNVLGWSPLWRDPLCARVSPIFCFQDGADLDKYLPKLWGSARRINVQFLKFNTLREQVFHRNKIDARGSIRKALNVISWTLALAKLRASGDKDVGAVIKAWNGEASKQQQLTGGKAQALNNVINLMPVDVLHDVVVPAVSQLGWEKCPWSDETFSIRRIYPGNVPRSGDGAWKERLTVTNESMRIMFLCQIDRHTSLEESAEQAALVHSMIREVKSYRACPGG